MHSKTQSVPANIVIRAVTLADAPVWAALRCALWPAHDANHAEETRAFFAGTLDEPQAVLIVETSPGVIVGFAELSIRVDVPGLEGKRTGYVEGLYVIPAARRGSIVRGLLQASRRWARQQECTAFASDRSDRFIIDKKF